MESIPRFLDAAGAFADGLVDVVGTPVGDAGGELGAVFGAEDEFGGVAGALLWGFVSGDEKRVWMWKGENPPKRIRRLVDLEILCFGNTVLKGLGGGWGKGKRTHATMRPSSLIIPLTRLRGIAAIAPRPQPPAGPAPRSLRR